jgi:alkylation response protein AidB-like acyl-CoA dehydrogenase
MTGTQTDDDTAGATASENPEAFRIRVRKWLAENMPRLPEGMNNRLLSLNDETGDRARELQQLLYAGGFAGLCFPKEYGGQGLTQQHQAVFTEESAPYEMPTLLNVPTVAILAATLLAFGSETQKQRHIRGILEGREIWVQMLSEPTNGSDLAGVITRAERDGDTFVLNGSKVWTSGAYRADYAMCLARTDWSVPKHRGLTMFLVRIHQPSIEVQRIRRVNGRSEFCQEFLNDVVVSIDDVIGEVNEGWAVTSALLNFEREATGGASPLISGFSGAADDGGGLEDLLALARTSGAGENAHFCQLLAQCIVDDIVHEQLISRVRAAIKCGVMKPPAGALVRLSQAVNAESRRDVGLVISGTRAAAAEEGSSGLEWARQYLYRQSGSLAGGSNEMQRNIISERALGMPKEFSADVGRPFSEVRNNSPIHG